MANFIIVETTLITFDDSIDDEMLRDLSTSEIGDCRLLLPINSILSIIEIFEENRTNIKLINNDYIYCKNTFDEIVSKINSAQVISSIQ